MQIRRILLILALLAFLSTFAGGYFYWLSLLRYSLESVSNQVSLKTLSIKDSVSSLLSGDIKSAKTLAGLKEVKEALLNPSPVSLAEVNALLDHFQDTLEASVCYLLDSNADTIASSNRNAPDSFVGNNYAFRPYFKQSMSGFPAVYMGLGATSKIRGVYYSYPVYGKDSKVPRGVAVIKAPVDKLEREFSSNKEGVALLVDPHGIIFLSSRKDWILYLLFKVSPIVVSEINETRQFGEGPWEWTGFEIKAKNILKDSSGKEYLFQKIGVDNYPGWNVIYLSSIYSVYYSLLHSFIKYVGFIIFAFCFFIGLAVAALYKKASYNIIQRENAEKLLQESEEKYRQLSIQDNLTKLYNSRHFYAQLKSEIERSIRYHRPLSLLLLDIDNFKNHNDNYGHLEGDKVLMKLGEVVKDQLRRSADTAYRYGGEEFTVILPETHGKQALNIAERIRKTFEAATFSPTLEGLVHLTISVGIAQYSHGEDALAFIQRADKNMYEAKRQGKNRVFYSEEDSS